MATEQELDDFQMTVVHRLSAAMGATEDDKPLGATFDETAAACCSAACFVLVWAAYAALYPEPTIDSLDIQRKRIRGFLDDLLDDTLPLAVKSSFETDNARGRAN